MKILVFPNLGGEGGRRVNRQDQWAERRRRPEGRGQEGEAENQEEPFSITTSRFVQGI